MGYLKPRLSREAEHWHFVCLASLFLALCQSCCPLTAELNHFSNIFPAWGQTPHVSGICLYQNARAGIGNLTWSARCWGVAQHPGCLDTEECPFWHVWKAAHRCGSTDTLWSRSSPEQVLPALGLGQLISQVAPLSCLTCHENITEVEAQHESFTHQSVSSVAQSCPTLCDPMNRSRPGLPVHHQLPEFAQTYVHRVGDAIQPSHPLLSPSPPALNLSQHQGLFQWVSSSHQVAKVLEFQLQHQSFQWIFRTDFLWDGLVGSPCSPRDSQESSPTPQFKSISSSVLSLPYSPTLTSIHDHWKNHSLD